MDDSQLFLTFEETAVMTVDELWQAATPDVIRLLKENRRVERKPARIHAPELAEYFSMWANTSVEGGLIAIGISDDGKFLGCLSADTKHINRLESEAHTICPDAHVDCKQVRIQRDKNGADDFLLLFRVQYHPRRVIHTTKGDAFIRLGESKHKLTPDEIRDLQNDKGEVRVEQELYPSYKYPKDFDANLLADFFKNAREMLSESHDDEEILVNRRLGQMKDGQFIPNVACVLLFAAEPLTSFPGAKIRFFRFMGETEGSGDQWNAVKDHTIEGPIPYLLQVAESLLDSQLWSFGRLGPDQRFYSAPEYPKPAWYEALVNACAHRSYGTLRNIPIFVKMFDNRLEIQSPGPFPPSVTAATIYGSHSPRNPNLMDALRFLKVVKCAAEGTRRMRRLMQESELPDPEFVERSAEHSLVRVTLRNNIKHRQSWIDAAATAVVSPEIDRTLALVERQLINHVADYGTINTSQAVKLTGKRWPAAHRLLLKLHAKGILRHIHKPGKGRDPYAHFVLSKRPPPSTEKG